MSAHQPLISVITPTYNRAHIIQRCIKSVLTQTFDDFEYIIVDDGSKDHTKEIISKINDSRVHYVKHERNQGQNAALNTGLTYANGTYIAFLDSDDEWLPQMLEKQIRNFKANPSADCSYTWAGYVTENNSLVPVREYYLSGKLYKGALEQGYICNPSTLMLKRTCFDRIGPFHNEFITCQDDDFCMRLAKYFEFGLVREVLALIHHDSGNQTITNRTVYANDWYKFFRKYEREILHECGPKTMAMHYIKTAKLFIRINDRSSARIAAAASLKNRISLMGVLLYLMSVLPPNVLKPFLER